MESQFRTGLRTFIFIFQIPSLQDYFPLRTKKYYNVHGTLKTHISIWQIYILEEDKFHVSFIHAVCVYIDDSKLTGNILLLLTPQVFSLCKEGLKCMMVTKLLVLELIFYLYSE